MYKEVGKFSQDLDENFFEKKEIHREAFIILEKNYFLLGGGL